LKTGTVIGCCLLFKYITYIIITLIKSNIPELFGLPGYTNRCEEADKPRDSKKGGKHEQKTEKDGFPGAQAIRADLSMRQLRHILTMLFN
jgi:hypothetical protein